MKETGVIRKIDELGRIVIPKEIRRTLGIKDGENLEIYVDKDSICLQKHSRLLPFQELAKKICEYTFDTMELSLFFMDREEVVASSLPIFLNHGYSSKLTKLLEERETYESAIKESLFDDVEISGYFSIVPIIVSTDPIGLLVLISKSPIEEYMKHFQNFITKLIVNKIDIL